MHKSAKLTLTAVKTRVLGTLLVLAFASGLHASVEAVKPLPTGARFKLSGGELQVEFVTDSIARIRATLNADFSRTPSLMRVPVNEKPGRISVKDATGSAFVELSSSKLTVRVDRASGAVSYLDSNGQLLLSEDSAQPHSFERTEVIKSVADPASVRKVQTVDGEREVADRYIQQKDRDAWKGGVHFHFADGEALYGLGFDETSDLNLRGKTKRLYQHNLRIVIPSLVSTRGYGLLFDAYSAMTFKDGPQGGSMDFDVIEDLDYYFIAGPGMNGAIAGYRQLTGAATMLPRWSFGYVQSKERYKSQDELINTVKEFRQRQIPLDGIVQDWNYWIGGQWGGDPDPKFYPDIAAMTKAIHDQNAHVMISIWPNPSPKSTAGTALAAGGYTLAGTTFFDAFNPKAREVYWNSIWQILGRHGIDAWWCDSTEPETADWSGTTRTADADSKNIAALAKIIDPQFLNAYAFEDSTGIYENSRKSSPDRRVLNLTRSGYAGSQRTGSVLWTGDIPAKWSTLAQQVVALQSFSASGNPYVTFDTGAFFVKHGKQWFWNGDFDKGVEDSGYRELYTRWLQVSAFLPMFRSHGTDTPREPWRFGKPGTPFYDAILGSINLRYQLMPYFYSLAADVSLHGASFLRPVAFAFPQDEKTHDLKTQFLVGDAFMVAPVLTPQQFGPNSTPIANVAKTREVYLPKGATWFDFWTGKRSDGGQTIQAEGPLAQIPLFVKAGSIVPIGPRVQYTNEKPDAPIELRVYPGAAGTFTLYEDEGDGYGYEKGRHATIPFTWKDRTRTLVIGPRQGEFPGMLKTRTFHVVLVAPGTGTGIDATATALDVHYDGGSLDIHLPTATQSAR
ncbi:MAG: glycoside hydrolase family 31 protein [Verrucomicrobia bacterium]|nr:glycoside hydrolase family 31 protein [Verrucomicrobiota bacterium]